jgi:hypothetical protein
LKYFCHILPKEEENYDSNTIRDTTYLTIQDKQVFRYATHKFYLIILNANLENKKKIKDNINSKYRRFSG